MGCLVCHEETEKINCWPLCSSDACFRYITQILNHKNTSCWIAPEIFCGKERCVSFLLGKHLECHILEQSRIMRERKEIVNPLDYWY